tara:strand:+ start:901 stop:1761 length:861 start_codon:yes stop_codon:yes gene_type:complete
MSKTSLTDIEVLERRAKRRMVSYDYCEMVWREFGSGPPLLLLHGGYGSWLHWVRNIEELSRFYRLVIPDMPAHGDSDPGPDEWEAEWVAEALKYGVERLVPENQTIRAAGFSAGGVVLGPLAVALGDRLTHAVMIGPNGMNLPYPPLPQLRSVTRLGPDATEAQIADLHRYNLSVLMFHDPAFADETAVTVQMRNVRQAKRNMEHVPRTRVLLKALPNIRARFAGLWGQHDVFVGQYMKLRETTLRTFQPDADFRVIENAGHWVMYEAPGAVNAAILEMVREQGQF